MKTAKEVIEFINLKTEITQYGDTSYDIYSFGVGVAKTLLWTCEIDQDTYDEVLSILYCGDDDEDDEEGFDYEMEAFCEAECELLNKENGR